jgi:hypothetical protein
MILNGWIHEESKTLADLTWFFFTYLDLLSDLLPDSKHMRKLHQQKKRKIYEKYNNMSQPL